MERETDPPEEPEFVSATKVVPATVNKARNAQKWKTTMERETDHECMHKIHRPNTAESELKWVKYAHS